MAKEFVLLDDTVTPADKKASPLLTVWRRLHVEVDLMGAEPPGTPFDLDDLLRGDVPDPDIGALGEAFRSAYITVLQDTGQDNAATPWPGMPPRPQFATFAEMRDYFVGANGQRGTRNEDDAWWSVYVCGIYEDFDPVLDNDPDGELCSNGLTDDPGGNQWRIL